MTGSWTGSAIASILDFKLWKAALAVFLGNIVAAGILTVIVAFVPNQYADFVLYGFIILAVALCVTLYFTRSSKREKKLAKEKDKYGNRSLYELAKLEQEANENGEVLIKKEYIDDDGNKHIVVGNDESRNISAVSKEEI
jgi:membrane protein implicated in regulation of membrane protease activity